MKKTKRNSSKHKYDVCLSFAGEDRAYVDRVADQLSAMGIRVFYDKYEEVELWGKDLYAHLDDVYQNAARYCVIFISEPYARKLWPSHERRSAQARAFRENQEYLLPARFDDTMIPGMPNMIGYIDLKNREPERLAELIFQKLGGHERHRYFPPFPDQLLERMASDNRLGEINYEEVLEQARRYYDVLTRLTPDERSVITSVFLNGCAEELPDNIHVDLDLLRRYTQFPYSKLKRLLGGISSLGFYVELREEPHGEDEYLGQSQLLYLEWHNMNSSAPGNATHVAFHVVHGAISGYCEVHALEALQIMDFSQLASPTKIIDDHD